MSIEQIDKRSFDGTGAGIGHGTAGSSIVDKLAEVITALNLVTGAGGTQADLILDVAEVAEVVSGVAALTQGVHQLGGEGNNPDTVTSFTGLTEGELFLVSPELAADPITLQHGEGANLIACPFSQDIVLAELTDWALGYCNGTQSVILAFSTKAANAGGTGAIIGLLTALTTTTKTSVVAAINEVDANADTAQAAVDALGAIGSELQAWDADLDALAGMGGTGLVTRTAGATYGQRSIAVASASLTVINGDGVLGNPTLDVAQDIRTTATPTFADVNVAVDVTPNGSGVEATSEQLQIRTLLLTLTATPVVMADQAGVVAYGSLKLADMPAGNIAFLGATMDLALTLSAAGINADWDGDVGLGTTAAGNDAVLTTTEQDIIPTTATPQAVASATTAKAKSTSSELAAGVFDGTTDGGGAKAVYLNLLVDDADHDVTTTPTNIICDGTIRITYVNLGDIA